MLTRNTTVATPIIERFRQRMRVMRFCSPVPVAVTLFVAAFATFACAYDEPEAVRARFPDPPIHYHTPGFAPGAAISRRTTS
jgi:hypothetical protein